ncbi:hypothetical protein J6590_103702 [Homalodisca vitripennis]|nr:hypothetical protein J6590_103702 [Homalodisca vitripennis]
MEVRWRRAKSFNQSRVNSTPGCGAAAVNSMATSLAPTLHSADNNTVLERNKQNSGYNNQRAIENTSQPYSLIIRQGDQIIHRRNRDSSSGGLSTGGSGGYSQVGGPGTEIFHFVCANRVRCRNSGNARRPPLRAANVLNRIPGLLGVPITFFGTSHNMIKNRDNPGFPGRLVTLL